MNAYVLILGHKSHRSVDGPVFHGCVAAMSTSGSSVGLRPEQLGQFLEDMEAYWFVGSEFDAAHKFSVIFIFSPSWVGAGGID